MGLGNTRAHGVLPMQNDLGNKSRAINCPNCRIPLHLASVGEEVVDRCDQCNGIWFDATELGSALRSYNEPVPCGDRSQDFITGLNCPNCDGILTPTNYANDSGLWLNKCGNCGGAWLESGQFERIVNHRAPKPKLKSLERALSHEIRVALRWQALRNTLRSRLLSGGVAMAYALFLLLAALLYLSC